MPVVSVREYVRSTLDGLSVTFPNGTLPALKVYLGLPPRDPMDGPRAYVAGTRMTEVDAAMGRSPPRQATYKIDIYLVLEAPPIDPALSEPFAYLIDAVMEAIRGTIQNPPVVNTSATPQSAILLFGRTLDLTYTTPRIAPEARLGHYQARLTATVIERLLSS